MPALESLLIRKWTDGKKAHTHQLNHFGKCKEIIKEDSTWSEEQEAHFVEKSLVRVENRVNFEQRDRIQGLSIDMSFAVIAESLPESERRDMLLE